MKGKGSKFFRELQRRVIEVSDASTWTQAVLEWRIGGVWEDEDCETRCVCTKEGLRYVFLIENELNRNELEPIGSSCIKRFDREDLTADIILLEQMFGLYNALIGKEQMSLDLLSRKLIDYLYEQGAFQPSKFNDYYPYNDYQFMLDMFNRATRYGLSNAQNKKVQAILLNDVKQFLQQKLGSRIRQPAQSTQTTTCQTCGSKFSPCPLCTPIPNKFYPNLV